MALGDMGLGELGLGEMGLGEMGLGELGLGEMGGHPDKPVIPEFDRPASRRSVCLLPLVLVLLLLRWQVRQVNWRSRVE